MAGSGGYRARCPVPHTVAADEDELRAGALDRLRLEETNEVAARGQMSPLPDSICALEPGPKAGPELRKTRGVVVHAALRIIVRLGGPSSPKGGTACGCSGDGQSSSLRAASRPTLPACHSFHGRRRWI